MAGVLDAKRPPSYDDALQLFRAGQVQLAKVGEATSAEAVDACYLAAAALFAGAQAAAAIRLIAPLPPGAR